MDARFLGKEIRNIKKKIAETGDKRERDFLEYRRKFLECWREALKIADQYALLYGEEEALKDLPPPVKEEEIAEFVRSTSREKVWERAERARFERDSYGKRYFYYVLRGRRKHRKEILLNRYYHVIRKMEVLLLYLYILKEEKK